jgi:4-methyl-5(b-hydroxyethyl)-thiazole monophosphate biosynthesis
MIAVLLAPGFEEVEALTVVDYLNRAGIEVRLVGVETGTAAKTAAGKRPLITGSHRITVQTDLPLSDLASATPPAGWAGVVIPGGTQGAANIAHSDQALSFIKDLYNQGRLVAAICAAPAVVLMLAGILKGKKVTCFPGMENRLRDCQFSEERVVVDGNLVTSRAAGTAAEFALKLVEILAGKSKADAIYKATLQQF